MSDPTTACFLQTRLIKGFNFMFLKFSRKHFEIPRVLPGRCLQGVCWLATEWLLLQGVSSTIVTLVGLVIQWKMSRRCCSIWF